MNLKPQDVAVLLKLIAIGNQPWTYASLAVDMALSPSQIHSSVQRALQAQLAIRKDEQAIPQRRNLNEFLSCGIRYVFVAERGELTRGVPTGFAAMPLSEHIAAPDSYPPVWPHPDGKIRGLAFSPLYKNAPIAALKDVNLYQLLALVDAIRAGRARERELAIELLGKRLNAGY